MDATALLAALFFCLPGSPLDQQAGESIFETPVAESLFIEVYLAEPIAVEKAQVPTITIPATVADPAIDSSAETDEPIEKDADLEDQIEPLFVEDGEATHDDESRIVESVPLDCETQAPQTIEKEVTSNNNTAEPAVQNAPTDVVFPNVVDDLEIIPEPHPETVAEPVDDPAGENFQRVEPAIVDDAGDVIWE